MPCCAPLHDSGMNYSTAPVRSPYPFDLRIRNGWSHGGNSISAPKTRKIYADGIISRRQFMAESTG